MIFSLPAPQRDPRRSHRAEMVRRLRLRALPEVVEAIEEPVVPTVDQELIEGILKLGSEARMKTLRMIAATQGEAWATQVTLALTAEIQKRRNGS